MRTRMTGAGGGLSSSALPHAALDPRRVLDADAVDADAVDADAVDADAVAGSSPAGAE